MVSFEEARAEDAAKLEPGQEILVQVAKVTRGDEFVWVTVTLFGARATFRFPAPQEDTE